MAVVSDWYRNSRNCGFLLRGKRRKRGSIDYGILTHGVLRSCAVCYTDFGSAYELVFPEERHKSVGNIQIEHDFSALKEARMYSPINTSLNEIIRNYCAK